MKLICYDIGSYTLKKAQYIEDKNSLREIGWQEFSLQGPAADSPNNLSELNDSSDSEESENHNQEPIDQYYWLDEVVEILKKKKPVGNH